MASEGSAGLVGKVEPSVNLSAHLGLDDILNSTSSATTSGTASSGVTIGNKSVASGRANAGSIGFLKSLMLIGILSVGFVGWLWWEKNGAGGK